MLHRLSADRRDWKPPMSLITGVVILIVCLIAIGAVKHAASQNKG
jgi:hypothetical protein